MLMQSTVQDFLLKVTFDLLSFIRIFFFFVCCCICYGDLVIGPQSRDQLFWCWVFVLTPSFHKQLFHIPLYCTVIGSVSEGTKALYWWTFLFHLEHGKHCVGSWETFPLKLKIQGQVIWNWGAEGIKDGVERPFTIDLTDVKVLLQVKMRIRIRGEGFFVFCFSNLILLLLIYIIIYLLLAILCNSLLSMIPSLTWITVNSIFVLLS